LIAAYTIWRLACCRNVGLGVRPAVGRCGPLFHRRQGWQKRRENAFFGM